MTTPKKSSVAETLKSANIVNPHAKRPPLWLGPESDTENGGITFSMLSRFIVCRERFRIQYLEGWRPADSFNARMEFGNMWHICEEANLVTNCEVCNGSGMPNGVSGYACPGCNWQAALKQYVQKLVANYPFDQPAIQTWYGTCKTMFPIYLDYWSTKKFGQISRKVTPLLQEQVFNVPYKLPSGRTVRLRGKWDEVVLVEDKNQPSHTGLWVGDHKTKSRVEGLAISRQLTNDLQTQLYLIALDATWRNDPEGITPSVIELGRIWKHLNNGGKIVGVRYNVIKRPAQYQGKKETMSDFHKRLEGIVKEKPEEFFARWETVFSPENVALFRKRTLDPLLEQLCDWYSWVICTDDPFSPNDGTENSLDRGVNSYIHWQAPFGVYNPLLEGGATDFDAFVTEGSTVGMVRSTELFTELR